MTSCSRHLFQHLLRHFYRTIATVFSSLLWKKGGSRKDHTGSHPFAIPYFEASTIMIIIKKCYSRSITVAYLSPGSFLMSSLLSSIASYKGIGIGKPFLANLIEGCTRSRHCSFPYLLCAQCKPFISPGIPVAFPPIKIHGNVYLSFPNYAHG